jgi:hypothetical protein
MLCFAILRGFLVDAESTILFFESAASTPRIKSFQNLTVGLRCESLSVCNDGCQEDCVATSLYAVRQTTKKDFHPLNAEP